MRIVWSEFPATAALGAMTIICVPLIVVCLPLYLLGRVVGRWIESAPEASA